MNSADLLLEIGTEEIPAGYLAPAARQLANRLQGWLQEQGIGFEEGAVEIFATPRRLAVLVRGVALEQRRRSELRLGPAVRAAYDPQGQPTRAALGFAQSVGVQVGDLERVETDKGERLAARVASGGRATRELLLSENWLRGLLDLGFPKTMRWLPDSDLRFARPIRWIVCLLGEDVVPIALEHLRAGRTSRGHRTLHPEGITLQRAGDYERTLHEACVVARPDLRCEQVREQAHRLAREVGGQLHEADDLLEEITYLLEYPTPVLGSFDAAFVDQLPPEVIITAMRGHQRYFSIEGSEGRPLPRFITFRDGDDRALDNVIEGNERVLRARLDDALFYWNTDRSHGSEEKLQMLERIVWLEGLGSMAERCARMAGLGEALAAELAPELDAATVRRAALLSKSDLATEMIRDGKEFTKLQGIIGRYYALEAGEHKDVADAIHEHHYPRFASDRLPRGALATIVALADRLDSISGCVLAGFAPTGGQDPYALRRQALAILRLLVENHWHLDLESWAQRALGSFDDVEDRSGGALSLVLDLFWGRLETLLADLPPEIVRAVLSVSSLDPVENVRAARALASMRGSDDFARLLEGAKRCRNILAKENRLVEEEREGSERAVQLRARASERWESWRGRAAGESPSQASFSTDLFEDPNENLLFEQAVRLSPRLERARSAGEYEEVFTGLSKLGPLIAGYFDSVLVNSPQPEIRENRLGFLEDIHYLFSRFADLSRVPSVEGTGG